MGQDDWVFSDICFSKTGVGCLGQGIVRRKGLAMRLGGAVSSILR